jgi:hypothetical protein
MRPEYSVIMKVTRPPGGRKGPATQGETARGSQYRAKSPPGVRTGDVSAGIGTHGRSQRRGPCQGGPCQGSPCQGSHRQGGHSGVSIRGASKSPRAALVWFTQPRPTAAPQRFTPRRAQPLRENGGRATRGPVGRTDQPGGSVSAEYSPVAILRHVSRSSDDAGQRLTEDSHCAARATAMRSAGQRLADSHLASPTAMHAVDHLLSRVGGRLRQAWPRRQVGNAPGRVAGREPGPRSGSESAGRLAALGMTH